MKVASVANVKAKFSQYVKDSGRSPVVITRNGKAVAALIPLLDDDDLERLMLGYSPKLRALLTEARKRIRSGQGVPHAEFWSRASNAAGRGKKRSPTVSPRR